MKRALRWLGDCPPLLLPLAATAACQLAVSAFVFRNFFRPGTLVELAIVGYAAVLLFAFQRRRRLAAIVLSAFSCALYAAALAKAVMLREAISIFDLASLDETAFVLPWPVTGAIAALGVLGCVLTVTNLRWPRRRDLLLCLPLAAFAIACIAAPLRLVSLLDALRPRVEWRGDLDVLRNGPWFTVLRQLPEVAALYVPDRMRTPGSSPPSPFDEDRALALFQQAPSPPPDLYIIVIESFIDPMNFRGVRLESDPIDPRFRRWLRESTSVALSPTFGGQTAAAEFEILCGVPAFGWLGVEFNRFSGSPIPCLPDLLGRAGYDTMATVPVEAWFFNTGRAYQSVGFHRRYLAPDLKFSDMDGDWISDDALFEQTKPRLEALRTGGRPFMSYIVTTDGHTPFAMNPQRRPPRFAGSTWAATLANVTFYTSRAVADFVEWIEARDPHAVIVAVGDHLPPLGEGGGSYRAEGYSVTAGIPNDSIDLYATPIVMRAAGKTVALGPTPHHALAEKALDLLLGGTYCRDGRCGSSADLIYRPRGAETFFTTGAGFPAAACRGDAPPSPACAEAQARHQAVRSLYWNLLRQGMR